MAYVTAKVGSHDYAPLFALKDQNDENVILRDKAGKPLVLVFYAKDAIPACKEIACTLRDRMAEIEQLGARIFSISTDSVADRDRFAKENHISFPMLSDTNLEASRKYGV